jgi:hypothetical protein
MSSTMTLLSLGAAPGSGLREGSCPSAPNVEVSWAAPVTARRRSAKPGRSPASTRTYLDRAVGYIKTHHASYLPPEQAAVVSALRPEQRTPAFTIGTSRRRTSWYLQLPRTSGVPWSGVIRLECSADLPLDEVTRLGDLTRLVKSCTRRFRGNARPGRAPREEPLGSSAWVKPPETARPVHGETGGRVAGQYVRLAHDGSQRPQQRTRKRNQLSRAGRRGRAAGRCRWPASDRRIRSSAARRG